jgi:DNA-binding winged helix-turn-helix (wHTH) protein
MRLAVENLVFDSDTREVIQDGSAVPLSPKAFALLELLIDRRPKAVPRGEIHERLWPGTHVTPANLANIVTELRSALGDDAREPRLVRTVRSFGYAFMGEARETGPPDAARRVSFRLQWGVREIPLAPGENLIGRDPGCGVWIDDTEVSRHHARILVTDAGATLQDLGSKNGTLWNGRKIEVSRSLADGDRIGVGSATLVLRAARHAESTKTAAGSRRGKAGRT